MESKSDNSQLEAVARAWKARMARAACLHLSQVEPRTSVALQIAGAFKRNLAQGRIPASELEILGTATHPLRATTCLGPFVFYKEASDTHQQCAVDMVDVLLSEDLRSRTVAVSNLEALATTEPPKLSQRTKHLLQSRKAEILTESAEVWQPASLELFDVMREDVLCQLAAVEQSLEQRFEDGLREYFPRVLRPSISLLEALELNLMRPSEQAADIGITLSACADRDTLQNACDHYLSIVGFLPLGAQYSLARVVQLWQERHNSRDNIWEVLWDWADRKQTPLARYHVSTIFLTRPEWGAQGRERLLWQELLEIISLSPAEDHNLKWQLQWKVRRELAQHYLHFLESQVPGAMSEPLAATAWWLAERVAVLVGYSTDALNNLRNIAIIPEAETSEYAWRLTLPRTVPSALANATHMGVSPWALSVLNQITAKALLTLSPGVDEETAHRFERSVVGVVMLGFLLKNPKPEDTVYAFEGGLSEAITAWQNYRNGAPSAELANAIVSMYQKLSNIAEFVPALQKIYEEDELNQMIIAHWAKSLAIQGTLPREEVWKCLSDSAWRKLAFTKLIASALDQLFLAFSLTPGRNDKVWREELPHMYANACEDAREDIDRRQLLFAFTALSCVHTASVSALQRLLCGNQRGLYIELSSRLRNSLLSSRNHSLWLAARIRAVLAATEST